VGFLGFSLLFLVFLGFPWLFLVFLVFSWFFLIFLDFGPSEVRATSGAA
jgi:hypothetical protein